MKKNYKSCEFCNCEDCKTGKYRQDSWFCPVLKIQICDICCCYDMDSIEYSNIRKACKKMKCENYRN